VGNYLNRAQLRYQNGRTANAYWDFAVAIYVITDRESSPHRTAGGNPYTWYGATDPRSQVWKHSITDYDGIETAHDVTARQSTPSMIDGS
jgi:hypothetical protein